MRREIAAVLMTGCAALTTATADESLPPLRFAWPSRGEARVELTDERTVGGETRSFVIEMRLRVEPDGNSDRLSLRLLTPRVVTVDGVPFDKSDPAGAGAIAARVMARLTPTIVVSATGRYVGSRETDRVVREILAAVGLPEVPFGQQAFSELATVYAATDWLAWVEAWIGDRLAPGESTRARRRMEFDGALIDAEVVRRGLPPAGGPDRVRCRLEAEYPSSAVRRYTTGFLIDMGKAAGELQDDALVNARFVERASFSPVTETVTAEIESGTMRPLVVERTRSFFATADSHRVEGRDRRTHRFTWEAPSGTP